MCSIDASKQGGECAPPRQDEAEISADDGEIGTPRVFAGNSGFVFVLHPRVVPWSSTGRLCRTSHRFRKARRRNLLTDLGHTNKSLKFEILADTAGTIAL